MQASRYSAGSDRAESHEVCHTPCPDGRWDTSGHEAINCLVWGIVGEGPVREAVVVLGDVDVGEVHHTRARAARRSTTAHPPCSPAHIRGPGTATPPQGQRQGQGAISDGLSGLNSRFEGLAVRPQEAHAAEGWMEETAV